MKGNHIALVLFGTTMSMLLVMLCAWRTGNAIFSMDSYQLSVNPLLSSYSKKIVKEIVAHNYDKPCPYLSDQLLKACPAIKNIMVQRCADHQLKIAIDVHDPYIQISDCGVLLDNGIIVHSQHFTEKSLEKIPQVQLAGYKDPFSLSKEFISWLKQLDSEVLNNFFISWSDDYQIYLQHKTARAQTILAGVNTPINGEIIQVCQQIVDQKINLEQGTARVTWCADIRFDKQIIVSSHKGGACHG